jgi:hypothetical protein
MSWALAFVIGCMVFVVVGTIYNVVMMIRLWPQVREVERRAYELERTAIIEKEHLLGEHTDTARGDCPLCAEIAEDV